MRRILQWRVEVSERIDPVAVSRGPSRDDVLVRETTVLAMGAVLLISVNVPLLVAVVDLVVDVRPPGELFGLPGPAALVALVRCRTPVRRDWTLSRLIAIGAGVALFFSATVLPVAGDAVSRGYWAACLVSSLLTIGLFFRWRTR
ncbi:hypothetical protein GCM10009547_10720 [Sporichthya brevicatena]|uniref:Uncharacterized protein n=1 Tax=Sporichthya brevicatena TaxID=171442 RepID=A0ABN1GFN8_9ACTN